MRLRPPRSSGERRDDPADALRDGGRHGHLVRLAVQQLGEARARRLGALDPELPLGAVLVPAGEVLLVGGAHPVRERALRARVEIGRVLEDRELAADRGADADGGSGSVCDRRSRRPEPVGRRDVGRQVRGRRAPRRREDAEHRELAVGARVLDDVHLARRDPEGGSRPRAPRPRRRGGSGPGRARSRRSRRRGGSATAPCRAGRSRRTSSRAREPLCGPKRIWNERLPVALPGSTASIATTRSRAPIGAWRSVSPPSVIAHERDPVRAGGELGLPRPRAGAPPSPTSSGAPVELAAAREREQQHVVAGIADLARLPRAELQRLERELGAPLGRDLAGCADDAHQRPRYALRRSSSSSRSAALPSSTTRPVERT